VGPGPTSCDWQGAGGFGNWNCFNNNFMPQPLAGQTVWGVIAFYPGDVVDATHEGWIMIDNSPGTNDGSVRPQSPQRLRIPTVVPGSFGPNGLPNSGFDIAFEYPTEFSPAPEVDGCHLGGDTDQTGFDARIIAGFNIYRMPTDPAMGGMAPADSEPIHWLCGVDGDCSDVSDTAWVAFVPLDPSGPLGLSVDDPSAVTPDPVLGPFGVAMRGGANPHIIFSDRPDPLDAEYAYTYQPVLRVNNLANLELWNGWASLDLNGDTQPEFIDPSGHGLGLCADGAAPDPGGDPIPLLAGEVVGDGGDLGCTPILGVVDLVAGIATKGRGVNLTFLSSIEGDVVGFNLFRSTDGVGFTRINSQMIAARGVPLGDYSYVDDFDVRRMRGGTLYYKVEVVLANGARALFGPYAVDVGGSATVGRARRR